MKQNINAFETNFFYIVFTLRHNTTSLFLVTTVMIEIGNLPSKGKLQI
jgi:hypothetical protein